MLPDLLQTLENAVFQRFFGKYQGKVTNNDDPEERGRLKVLVPGVLRDVEKWAMPCVPYAGPQVGFYFIPPTGAGVWVEFEAGDPSRPIWVGCYWGTNQLPPDATSPDVHVLTTGKTQIRMDDSGDGVIEIRGQSNVTITLTTGIETAAGGATHTVSASGVVSESSPGKLEVGPAGVTANSGALSVGP